MRIVMASDAVPAAADGPNTPPGNAPSTATGNQPATSGGLSGLLAPVQPARTDPATFNLNPDEAPTINLADEMGAVSSADYHSQNGQNTTQNSNSTGTGSKQQQSIWRAWMLAGAERWRKGADARNKTLDIQKARAQAVQVKENRTVNRSEKHVGGTTNTGTNTNSNAGKSLNSKTSNAKKDTGNGAKNNNTTAKTEKPGRNNGTGTGRGRNDTRDSAGGSTGAKTKNPGGRDRDGNKNSGTDSNTKNNGKNTGKTDSGKTPKTDGNSKKPSTGSKGSTDTGRTGASGKTGPQGTAGQSGKPGKDAPTNPSSKSADGRGTKDHKGQDDQKDRPAKQDQATRVDLEKKPTSTDKPKTPKTDDKKTPASDTRDTKATDLAPGSKTPPTAAGTGKPINIQESRETGYRDGVRAGTVAAHVGAWRDGARDGWRDRKADAAREKARLDQAHADRQQPAPPQPQKVPPMPTHAPTAHHEPQPIQVTAVTKDGISLGTGANRSSIGHGEVRRLKDYERKMTAKADTMGRIAEGSRGLKEHAEQQLKHVTWLTEQARIIEGGTSLLEALTKLQEAATIQAHHAEEVVRRAARSGEACTVLVTNVATRYGSIYKAVVDSGLIKPAHLRYYEDTVNA